jgi:hypothetical protein
MLVVDCQPDPMPWPIAFRGYSTTGQSPCEDGNVICEWDESGWYVWTISGSETHPWLNTDSPGEHSTLYLWFECSASYPPMTEEIWAAEFALTGTLDVLEFVPRNGFENHGTDTNLLLLHPDCATPPLVVGEIILDKPITIDLESWSETKGRYR